MDEIKKTLKNIKDYMGVYHNKRNEIWNEIKNEKCKYCEGGQIVYDLDGQKFYFDCEDYFISKDCSARTGYLYAVLGKRFINTDISMFSESIRKYVENYDYQENVIIIGSIGTGKTTLIGAFLIKAKKDRKTIIVKRPVDIVRDVFNGDYNNLKTYKSVDLFCIDDLGMESNNPVFDSNFEDIIDERWRRMRATIVTSNLEPKQLDKIYPRAFDRLLQNSKFIELTGESFRRRKWLIGLK